MTEKIERITLSELIEDQSIFDDYGKIEIPVNRNGKTVILEIPIKASGLAEKLQAAVKGRPKPPVKIVQLSPEECAAEGIERGEKVIYDYTDAAYITSQENYGSNVVYRFIASAIDLDKIDIRDKAGNKAEELEKIVEILKTLGLTQDKCHLAMTQIAALKQYNTQRTDFLSEAPLG